VVLLVEGREGRAVHCRRRQGYIESKQSAVRDMAAIGQMPAQNLGVDALSNISEATLAGLETGKKRKTARFKPLWVNRSSRCCGRAPTSPVTK
jgi:hypothetical protein